MNLRIIYSPKYFNEYTLISQKQNFSLIVLFLIIPNLIQCSYSTEKKDQEDVKLYLKCIGISKKIFGFRESETINKMRKDSEFLYIILLMLFVQVSKDVVDLVIAKQVNKAFELLNNRVVFKIDNKLQTIKTNNDIFKVFGVESVNIEDPIQIQNNSLAQQFLSVLEHLDIQKNILNKSEISFKYSQILNGA